MFQLNKTIISEEILEKEFVCNLSACKGTCCIDGEAGAPLEKEETDILEKIYPKVKPFLRKEGIDAIEKQGTWVTGDFDELDGLSYFDENFWFNVRGSNTEPKLRVNIEAPSQKILDEVLEKISTTI